MVNKFLSFILASLLLITIYLSLFELLLYTFHSPFQSHIEEPFLHHTTWIYLLQQKYISFIELDIFTIYEKRHLLDVKRVFEETHQVWILFLFLTGSLLLLFIAKLKTQLSTLLQYLYLLGFIFNSILTLFIFNFLNSFKFFHTLLFSANTWSFAPTSLLIKWFPLRYFQEFTLLFLFLSFLLFLLLFFIKTYATILYEYFNNRR